MKKILITILSIFYVTVSTAQVDEKAKKILDELSVKTKSYTSISAEFTYTVENKAQKKSETNPGKVAQKGNKFKLDIANQVIINDTKTSWTILKDAKEVQVNTVGANKDKEEINPANLFTMYEKGFKFEFVKEEKQKNVLCQVIKLYPLEPKKKNFHTVILTIDKVKKQIVSIKVLGKDGNDLTYNVKTFTPNAASVTDDLFTFNPKAYPGYEVVDLRE